MSRIEAVERAIKRKLIRKCREYLRIGECLKRASCKGELDVACFFRMLNQVFDTVAPSCDGNPGTEQREVSEGREIGPCEE